MKKNPNGTTSISAKISDYRQETGITNLIQGRRNLLAAKPKRLECICSMFENSMGSKHQFTTKNKGTSVQLCRHSVWIASFFSPKSFNFYKGMCCGLLQNVARIVKIHKLLSLTIGFSYQLHVTQNIYSLCKRSLKQCSNTTNTTPSILKQINPKRSKQEINEHLAAKVTRNLALGNQ